LDKEAKQQHKILFKQMEDLHDKIDNINVLIVGDPPETKGVFQRLDDTNGTVSFHTKILYGLGGITLSFAVWLVQFLLLK